MLQLVLHLSSHTHVRYTDTIMTLHGTYDRLLEDVVGSDTSQQPVNEVSHVIASTRKVQPEQEWGSECTTKTSPVFPDLVSGIKRPFSTQQTLVVWCPISTTHAVSVPEPYAEATDSCRFGTVKDALAQSVGPGVHRCDLNDKDGPESHSAQQHMDHLCHLRTGMGRKNHKTSQVWQCCCHLPFVHCVPNDEGHGIVLERLGGNV